MRTCLNLIALILTLIVRSVFAGETTDDALLAAQRATVLVLVEYDGQKSSGSGFLVEAADGAGFIATNAHVVGASRKVSAVFNSGQAGERILTAQVICKDVSWDLAVIKVTATDLPPRIEIPEKPEAKPTTKVFCLGFPLGTSLAAKDRNPAVTVLSGTISRSDSEAVQLDINLNPGNSGGPVVNSSGRLVGIAAAKITATRTGFAIPAGKLSYLLRGQMRNLEIQEKSIANGVAKYEVFAELFDPLNRIKDVFLQRVGDPMPIQEGRPNELQYKVLNEVRMEKAGVSYSATIEVPGSGKHEQFVDFRSRLSAKDGTERYSITHQMHTRFSNQPNLNANLPRLPDLLSPQEIAKASMPKPDTAVVSNKTIGNTTRIADDAIITEIDVGAREYFAGGVVWARDNKSFYLASKDGFIRRIALPDFKELCFITLKNGCSSIALSKAGLLVRTARSLDMCILNENTLALERMIELPRTGLMTSNPNSSFAYVCGDNELITLDLKSEKVAAKLAFNSTKPDPAVKKHSEGNYLDGFQLLETTPNGEYLFCESLSCLHRMKITGDTLQYEEYGPRIGNATPKIDFSPDSKYVTLTRHNLGVKDHPKDPGGGMGIFIYATENLQMPKLAVWNLEVSAAAYEEDLRAIYLFGCGEFRVYGQDGVKYKAYEVADKNELVLQMLLHRTGRRMLYLTEKQLFWVEFKPKPAGK